MLRFLVRSTSRLSLSEPITKPVRCDNKEYSELLTTLRVVINGADIIETIRDKLVAKRDDIVRAKGAAVLFRVAAILSERHLDAVTLQRDALYGPVSSLNDCKAHH